MTALRFALAGLLLTIPPCHPKSNCAPGHTWVGDRCLATDCAHAKTDAFCVQDDGTTGNCFAGTCQTVDLASNDNCGTYGLVCPQGEACQIFYGLGYCAGATGINTSCDSTTVCPSGYKCFQGDCVRSRCNGDDEGQPCTVMNTFEGYSYKSMGVCCDSACLPIAGSSPAEYAPFDDHHCGGCGIDCGSSGSCVANYASGYAYECVPSTCSKHDDGAQCSLGDAGTYDGELGTCCGGSCSDLQQQANCGVCGLACPSGLSCYYGYCAAETDGQLSGCDSTTCPSGWACLYGYYCVPTTCKGELDNGICTSDGVNLGNCCGGTCTNRYGSDDKNCGACGIACPDGAQCSYGSCIPTVDCSQNADNVSCQTAQGYGSCCEGQCQAQGPYGWCGSACEKGDVRSDAGYGCIHVKSGKPDNRYCQADTDCPDGYGCASGSCYQQACPAGYDNAFCAFPGSVGTTTGYCCGGQCVDIYNDSNNCGSCGGICSAQTTCQYGGCYGPNFGFTGCPTDGSGCASGSACATYGGTCRTTSCSGADNGVACAYGSKNGQPLDGVCCGGNCVATSSDPANCGSCGASCGSDTCLGYSCASSSCAPACPSGEVCAGGTCVGSVCDPVPASYLGPLACAADDGTVGSCCASGACEEILSDPQNCGGCGIKCPQGKSCKQGLCSGASKNCGPDRLYAYCDLEDGDLSKVCCPGIGCADTGTDAENCGGCGVACADGQICSAGTCATPGGVKAAQQQ